LRMRFPQDNHTALNNRRWTHELWSGGGRGWSLTQTKNGRISARCGRMNSPWSGFAEKYRSPLTMPPCYPMQQAHTSPHAHAMTYVGVCVMHQHGVRKKVFETVVVEKSQRENRIQDACIPCPLGYRAQPQPSAPSC
jgi:hypothetical protein